MCRYPAVIALIIRLGNKQLTTTTNCVNVSAAKVWPFAAPDLINFMWPLLSLSHEKNVTIRQIKQQNFAAHRDGSKILGRNE